VQCIAKNHDEIITIISLEECGAICSVQFQKNVGYQKMLKTGEIVDLKILS
jgi:hypothetical protein